MLLRPLSKELQEKAIHELNEVPSRLEEDVKHILEWASQQPHLKIRTDEQWIVSFLRGCKFSLQKTKEKLDLYYTFRSVAPDFFTYRDPCLPEIQECFKRNVFVMLPPEPSNALAPSRCFVTSKDCDPDVITLKLGMKAMVMLSDILLREDDACAINGQEVIYDLGTLRYNYVAQATPSYLRALTYFMQTAYPTRIKGIYFLNAPSFFVPFIKLFMTFFSKKIGSRIRVYSENNINEFYKEVPLSVLPEEYGGTGGSIKEMSRKLAHKFESYRQWFQEDSMYCSDETKRPEKPKIADEFLGVEGSFRKLEID